MFPRANPDHAIDVEPNPPVSGQGASATVPHGGDWHVFITDANGGVTELGPLRPDATGKLDIPVPANSDGSTLTITDEGEPIPSDISLPIVSTG